MHQKTLDRTPSALRLCRVATGLTQEELAARSGVAAATIGRLEMGRHSPQGRTAQALANVFELPIEKLFPDLGEPR